MGAWEAAALAAAGSGLGALEGQLAAIGRHNLGELASLQASLRAAGASGLSGLSGAVAEAEAALHAGLAVLLDARWPARRWPVHVFTAGAMACMLTSSVCHLFGCCAAHVSAVMWRFDYAGIAGAGGGCHARCAAAAATGSGGDWCAAGCLGWACCSLPMTPPPPAPSPHRYILLSTCLLWWAGRLAELG